MKPADVMQLYSKWLRAQMEEDHGPKAKWPKRTRDRFYAKLGEMVLFTRDLENSEPAKP